MRLITINVEIAKIKTPRISWRLSFLFEVFLGILGCFKNKNNNLDYIYNYD